MVQFVKFIIISALCSYIDCDNKDCVIESIRVLGNLSRSKITRDHVIDSGSFRRLIDMLEKGNRTLVTLWNIFVYIILYR